MSEPGPQADAGPPWRILFLDNHHLVVHKPAGLLTQGDKTDRPTLLALARAHLKERFGKPGNVFLGLVHRLDRPASGVVIFARTSKAAARLSDQFRRRRVEKTYWAWVEGIPPAEARLEHPLERDGYGSVVVAPPRGQRAALTYRRLETTSRHSLLEIRLETGRRHQIRVQLAHIGHPILGDLRYGARTPWAPEAIALHARTLRCQHIVTRTLMTWTTDPDPPWPGP